LEQMSAAADIWRFIWIVNVWRLPTVHDKRDAKTKDEKRRSYDVRYLGFCASATSHRDFNFFYKMSKIENIRRPVNLWQSEKCFCDYHLYDT
jgi:hypothetical protein